MSIVQNCLPGAASTACRRWPRHPCWLRRATPRPFATSVRPAGYLRRRLPASSGPEADTCQTATCAAPVMEVWLRTTGTRVSSHILGDDAWMGNQVAAAARCCSRTAMAAASRSRRRRPMPTVGGTTPRSTLAAKAARSSLTASCWGTPPPLTVPPARRTTSGRASAAATRRPMPLSRTASPRRRSGPSRSTAAPSCRDRCRSAQALQPRPTRRTDRPSPRRSTAT